MGTHVFAMKPCVSIASFPILKIYAYVRTYHACFLRQHGLPHVMTHVAGVQGQDMAVVTTTLAEIHWRRLYPSHLNRNIRISHRERLTLVDLILLLKASRQE